jgi:4-diphosphocytidyl-2-C-methyl-D-erythritol kinase
MKRLAPAKVNLFLHVAGPSADGFHPLCSLMAFVDMGDEIALTPGGEGLRIMGRFAEGLDGEADNLVLRARDTLLAAAGRVADFGLTLDKRLPVASGLGGGSSDAAATLRLVRDHLGLELTDDDLRSLAGALGSDTPACVAHEPVIATGRGDVLAPAPAFADLPAVLVNPGVASPTGPVYRAYDEAVSPQGDDLPDWPRGLTTAGAVAAFLATCRNDLQAPAINLQPAIAGVLTALGAEPETRLARMSGSGATCFALCDTPDSAARLAGRLSASHSSWWIRAATIKGAR